MAEDNEDDDKAEAERLEKQNNEFAKKQLKQGTPQANIALLIFLANVIGEDVEVLHRDFKESQEQVRKVFQSL